MYMHVHTLYISVPMLVSVCIRYIAAHMVGRRLIYPGSILLLNMAVGELSRDCEVDACTMFSVVFQLNRVLEEERLTKGRYEVYFP